MNIRRTWISAYPENVGQPWHEEAVPSQYQWGKQILVRKGSIISLDHNILWDLYAESDTASTDLQHGDFDVVENDGLLIRSSSGNNHWTPRYRRAPL